MALAHAPGKQRWQALRPRQRKGVTRRVHHRLVPVDCAREWPRTALGLRRYDNGKIEGLQLSEGDILTGERALAEVRALLAAMATDRANRCIASDDLYPAIILTRRSG